VVAGAGARADGGELAALRLAVLFVYQVFGSLPVFTIRGLVAEDVLIRLFGDVQARTRYRMAEGDERQGRLY
jgi:hypothetical protein